MGTYRWFGGSRLIGMINYHYISPEFLPGYAPISAHTTAFTSKENAEGNDHGHDQ